MNEETKAALEEIEDRLDALEETMGKIISLLGQNPDHKEALKSGA